MSWTIIQVKFRKDYLVLFVRVLPPLIIFPLKFINTSLDSVSSEVRNLAERRNFADISNTEASKVDPFVIRNHLKETLEISVGFHSQSYYELVSFKKILDELFIEKYQGRTLQYVIERCRQVLAACWTCGFVKRPNVASNLQSINFVCSVPSATLAGSQTYRLGANGKPVSQKRRIVKYRK